MALVPGVRGTMGWEVKWMTETDDRTIQTLWYGNDSQSLLPPGGQ